MASPGEDNLQILGILSLEVRTQRLTFSCFRWECYELLGGRFQESSEEPRERTSKGRVGSVLALGTGPGCLRGKLPPAAHLISAANYVFTHFIIRVQKEQLTGGCAI